MDGALLQMQIWKGYAKAASILGTHYNQFRASSATSPLAIQNRIANFPVSLNAEDMKYGKPSKYAKPTWYGLFDGTKAKVGDYLVGAGGTFFVAAMQLLLPILMVECNRTISVFRPQQQTGVGAAGYGGNTAATETVLMAEWPASILQGTKGERNETNLPSDIRTPWWTVLMPSYPGVTINTSDIITDDLGRRYAVSSPELSDLGWRITCALAEP